jgi:ubiquinone/menaquinone biosynthesis C-methylase UbiE
MATAQSEQEKARVQSFWEAQPCGAEHADAPEGTPEFFAEVERKRDELEPFIADFADFEGARGERVLEIGVGAGTDFVRFARAGAQATGVDLTEHAIALVRRRLDNEGLQAQLHQADAEHLPFEDATFDRVYSWGVLHHTPDTAGAVREALRVLRPGGEICVMLYSRHSWVSYGVWAKHGLLKGRPTQSLAAGLAQHVESEGTKGFTKRELRAMFSGLDDLRIEKVLTPYDRGWAGPLTRVVGDPLGWFVVTRGRKSAAASDPVARLRALSAATFDPAPPVRNRAVDGVMALAARTRSSAHITPHIHGGSARDKILFELRAVDEFWASFEGAATPADLTDRDVLDVGCGWGGKAIANAELGRPRSMVGFDLPELMDPSAPNAFAAERGLTTCHFETGDAEDMPYADGSFDVAILDDVLEHVTDPRAVMRECARVLRPGGLVLAKFPSIKMMGAHHLDRAIAWPALHFVLPLRTWVAGLNSWLLRSDGRAPFEPFERVRATEFHPAVPANLNGMDFAAFARVADESGLQTVRLAIQPTNIRPEGWRRAALVAYDATRRVPELRERLGVTLSFVGRRPA